MRINDCAEEYRESARIILAVIKKYEKQLKTESNKELINAKLDYYRNRYTELMTTAAICENWGTGNDA